MLKKLDATAKNRFKILIIIHIIIHLMMELESSKSNQLLHNIL